MVFTGLRKQPLANDKLAIGVTIAMNIHEHDLTVNTVMMSYCEQLDVGPELINQCCDTVVKSLCR